MEEFKNLRRVALNEARKLDAAYANKDEFSEADIKKYDCIMHALKCQLTAEAMMEADGYEGNVSGTHGRNMPANHNSYSEGYDQGYSAAMNQMNNPYYPDRRRW